MATARRLYLYLVSGAGLALVVGGAATMLRLLFGQGGMAAYPSTYLYGPLEALSSAIAMMVVGLPLWLIHWGLVQRMTAGDGEEAAAERSSIVRSAYFSLVMIYLLVAGAGAFVDFLREGFARPLGATDFYTFVSLSGSASTAVIYLAAWLAHAIWRARDLRDGRPFQGVAAWIGRLYLYGAALIAALWTLGAAQGLIGLVIDAVSGHVDQAYPAMGSYSFAFGRLMPAPPPAGWWARPILSMLAQLVVWAPLWALHWLYSVRLTAVDGLQARAERASRLRLGFFLAVVAIGVGFVIRGLGRGLAAALGAVVGVGTWAGPGPLWRDALVVPATTLPLAFAWWWHRRRAMNEAASSDWPDSPARAIGYLTALIGLGVFGYGLAAAVGLILPRLTGTGSYDAYALEAWRWQEVQGMAFAVVALPIWLWPWLAIRRRVGLDRAAETRSVTRRVYLFVVVGATILTAAAAAAYIVYRVTRDVIVPQAASSGSGQGSAAVGALIVTLPLLAYHLAALRADLAVNGESPRPVGVEARSVGVSAPPAIRELVIVGPPGADLGALEASLADRLPEGYSIRARAPEDTTPG